MKKSSYRLGAVAAALLVFAAGARSAEAVDLAATGKAFAGSLGAAAAACKSKITGINADSLKAVFGCLVDAVKKTAASALVVLAQSLYGEAVALLKDKAPLAKQKLQELAGKITAMVPAAKAFLDPVINGIVDAGGDALVAEAGKCKAQITAITLDAAKATFSCLGNALKIAGKTGLVAIAQGLWQEFTNLLSTKGCDFATAKLTDLANKLAAAVPQIKGMVGAVIPAISTACKGGVDKLSGLKLP